MTTVLDAKAVITGEDRTGPAFDSIERRIAAASKSAAHIAGASARVAAASKQAASAAAATAGLGGSGATGGLMAGAAAAYRNAAALATTVGAGVAAHKAIAASNARLHEQIRMNVAGMTAEEISAATAKAAEISAKMPSIRQTDALDMIRNARSIVGSYEEAAKLMEPLAKLRVIAQARRPGEEVGEDFDLLLKGIEIKGATQDPEEFKRYMEGIGKGLNISDTLKPHQWYEMFKYGRQATPGLSEKFILTTGPSLAESLGGSSYGKAVSAFNSAVVGNKIKHTEIKDLIKMGLVDRKDVEELKSGEFKFKPGAHVKGWQMAQADPNEWVRKYLLPAFERVGITKQEDILSRISGLFQNMTAAQMVSILATQQARIDKDAAMYGKARGLDAADVYTSKDPNTAWQGLKNAFGDLSGALGESFSASLAPTMTDLSRSIASYTQRIIEADLGRKRGATPESETRFNRALDQLVVSSDLIAAAQRGLVNIGLMNAGDDLKAATQRFLASTGLATAGGGFGVDPRVSAIHMNAHRAPVSAFDLGGFRRPAAPKGIGAAAHFGLAGAVGSGGIDFEKLLKDNLVAEVKPDQITAKLEGAAQIGVKLEVMTDKDTVVKTVLQEINAQGALRADTGRSMPEAAPGAMMGR